MPWSHAEDARTFFRWLVGYEPWSPTLLEEIDVAQLAPWLVHRGLGPLVHNQCRQQGRAPALVAHLQADAYSALAENSLHLHRLQEVADGLAAAGISAVLLKGMALAGPAYGDLSSRTMSDIDLWIKPENLAAAGRVMGKKGFRFWSKQSRPIALEILNEGELQFYDSHNGLVEIHGSPLKGWWLYHTARLDSKGMWERTEPYGAGESVAETATNLRRLSTEDMVLQLAVHLVVNHQFTLHAIRGLIDIALTARVETVDWGLVARRARRWQVATPVWLALHQLDRLIGVEAAQAVLGELRPGFIRRRILNRLVPTHSLLTGANKLPSHLRFLLLLLLVDRPVDVARLIFRTLWPEPLWLEARYDGNVTHWQHLWRVLRYGQV